MSYAGRIRIYLFLMAFLPPLLILSVVYFTVQKNNREQAYLHADENLRLFVHFDEAYNKGITGQALELSRTEFIKEAAISLSIPLKRGIDISRLTSGFDFIELLDTNLIVLASHNRPGLVNNPVHDKLEIDRLERSGMLETVEYDITGRHPSRSFIVPINQSIFLYTGKFLDEDYIDMIAGVISAEIELVLADDQSKEAGSLENLEKQVIYQRDGQYYSLLAGGKQSGYYLLSHFPQLSDFSLYKNFIVSAGLVSLGASLLALFLGIIVTGKAKKEIDNLTEAFARVAAGDFSTTVMAYEESEFSRLADSFSEMVTDLKATQKKLATSEKISAWKIVGQKVAHEIKNPLTPIAISIDDLQKSYNEKLPDFDNILNETTTTIKNELTRLTRLLDQFVSFARMKPPEPVIYTISDLINDLEVLYRNEQKSGRVRLENSSRIKELLIDPDAIKQVFINLIKNGLESADDTSVLVTFTDERDYVKITIEDNGPGFTSAVLENSFTPYLTTKEDGSGLGLAVCQRIIFDHDGTIELYNRENGGAGVAIFLPVKNG
jgi:signal transduction histidine kinase